MEKGGGWINPNRNRIETRENGNLCPMQTLPHFPTASTSEIFWSELPGLFLMYDADPVNLCSRWKSNLTVKCRQQYFLKRKRQWTTSGCVLRQFVPNFFDFLYLDFFDGHSTAPASGTSHRSLNPHGHKMMLPPERR